MTSPRNARRRRVTVVTAGHLSTCPRMLKSADAFAAAGFEVRVVATCHEPWAVETDRDVRSRRAWPVEVVDYRRGARALTYWRTGARYRAARTAAALRGPARSPLGLVARAFGRVHPELVRAATSAPADLLYGGTTGALAAVAEAARRLSIPYGIDLEDWHSGESSGRDAPLDNALAARVEASVLRDASFATTSSEPIAAAYRDRYGVEPAVVHNTFPLPPEPPDFSRRDPSTLRLYWFSQTIGPGRGLEEAVVAAGLAGITAELALRGRAQPGYLEALRALAAAHAPRLAVVHHAPASPDAMIDVARGYDVGLALELMAVPNRQLCLTNKAFTYILAGVAVAISDTPGQHALGVDLGHGAALVAPADPDALAAALARWSAEPAALDCAKRASWQAATRRWHWEHPLEEGALLNLVRRSLA
jgi:glycosyltransferase involved in cell wall biosynthesis